VILKSLQWDCDNGATGQHAAEGPLGATLTGVFAEKSGQPMSVRLAVIEIRDDWPAWTEMTGYRTWKHKLCPCPCCNVPLASLTDLRMFCIDGGHWEQEDEESHGAEVARHEITITVESVNTQRLLKHAIVYRESLLGRALARDIPHFNLLKGDRLEPSTAVPDISRFEFADVPFEATFWRSETPDRLLHNSPLMSIIGCGPHSWAIDLLHSWHLGPEGYFIAHVCRFVIRSKIFSFPV